MGLTMAPVETPPPPPPTAVQQDQPILVLGDDAIYSVGLESSVPSVRPVLRWTGSECHLRACGVCGTSILGIAKDSRTVVVYDAVTLATAPGPRLRSAKRMPVMLAVGDQDDTVVVMDKLLRRRRDGSSASCFELLRRLPGGGGGGGWRAEPLPDAPVQDLDDEELEDELGEDYFNPAYVAPYFVTGTRLWISVLERGTFSLDLSASGGGGGGAWRVEGSWQLPVFSHDASFVEELGCAVGLVPSYDTSRCHQVRAIDVVEAQKEHRAPVLRHAWEFPTELAKGVPAGEMIDLAYLGNGTFCMARCVIVNDAMRRGTSFTLPACQARRAPCPPLAVWLVGRRFLS